MVYHLIYLVFFGSFLLMTKFSLEIFPNILKTEHLFSTVHWLTKWFYRVESTNHWNVETTSYANIYFLTTPYSKTKNKLFKLNT